MSMILHRSFHVTLTQALGGERYCADMAFPPSLKSTSTSLRLERLSDCHKTSPSLRKRKSRMLHLARRNAHSTTCRSRSS